MEPHVFAPYATWGRLGYLHTDVPPNYAEIACWKVRCKSNFSFAGTENVYVIAQQYSPNTAFSLRFQSRKEKTSIVLKMLFHSLFILQLL